MAIFKQFQPDAGNATTKTVTATTTSARYTLPTGSGFAAALRIFNEGSVTAFIAFGDITVTAVLPATDGSTLGSTPLGSGAIEIFTKTTDTYFAVITRSTTAQLNLTFGQGA